MQTNPTRAVRTQKWHGQVVCFLQSIHAYQSSALIIFHRVNFVRKYGTDKLRLGNTWKKYKPQFRREGTKALKFTSTARALYTP